MACRANATLQKTPAEVKLKGWDYAPFLAYLWEAGAEHLVDDVIRPPGANGFQYRCMTAGQSGTRAPLFPLAIGQQVVDGSLVWQTEAISTASLRTTITGSTWTASDVAITFSGEATDSVRQRTSANIHGGSSGVSYVVTNTVTMNDLTVEESKLDLEVC